MAIQVAALGAKGVSELISLGGLALGASAAIASLPSDKVTISPIALSLVSPGTLYVGDRFQLSANIDVSFGQVLSTNGKLKVEFFESGNDKPLDVIARESLSAKETLTFNVRGVAIFHGKKFYTVKVTASGDDDVEYWPDDNEVTRTRESNPVAIEIQKPLEVTQQLLTPSVNHGQHARALMNATNHSETDCYLAILAMGARERVVAKNIASGERRKAVDYLQSHPGENHPGTETFYIEPNKLLYALYFITKADNSKVWYHQTAIGTENYDTRPQAFDPLAVLCNGSASSTGKKIGHLIPDSWDQNNNRTMIAISVRPMDEGGNDITCRGSAMDFYGNQIIAENAGNQKLSFKGELAGDLCLVTVTPSSKNFHPYSTILPINQKALDEFSELRFMESSAPTLRGQVVVENEDLQVKGCRIKLKDASDQIIDDTFSNAQGQFVIHSNISDYDDGELNLEITLPENITYDWVEKTISKKISLKELQEDALLFIKAQIPPVPEDDWVSISGTIIAGDYLTRKNKPVQGVKIVVKDEFGMVQDKTTSGANGEYEFGIKPGRYILELPNLAELGFASIADRLFSVRTSRTERRIKVHHKVPEVVAQSSDVIAGSVNNPTEADTIVVLDKEGVVDEIPINEKGLFYIETRKLKEYENVKIALARKDIVGRKIELPLKDNGST